jgi:DNA-directed RNA polymerase subunit RPC12/RpoP
MSDGIGDVQSAKTAVQSIMVADTGLSLSDLSTVFVKSGFFKDVREQSQAIVKVLVGQELGLKPLQSGVCAICHGVNPSGRRLAIDHDHDTKRVRALLCGHCNHRILGHLTVEKARRALAILESDFDGRDL